ncbi:MAG: FtsX-like permease family protein [Gammaproteobacteria bacterium]|nr:FtsX-like permease family protein [Gammaproteobacteria bacterium]MDH4257044.1 FtsX-like permease family protein [Gammaproteobacteria bacterium]MDH5311979.1 FtsX-like permease family protein [Gammaproteobacteria bacterium]
MNITLRLAWRNLWRHSRRTWLTLGAMAFSNILLVFMISLQFGMYGMMIDNTLRVMTGHLQVQAEGYKDEHKMRQTVPDIAELAASLRRDLELERVAPRALAFALASSSDRTYGLQIAGVDPARESLVSSIPGLVRTGNYLAAGDAAEIVIGSVLARNLRVGTGDEVTLLGSGLDGSFAAAVVTVSGIFETGVVELDRGLAEVPLGFFQDVFFMEGAGHQVVIAARDLDEAALLTERTRELVADNPGLVVHDWDALQPGLRQAIKADMSSAFFMYGILVILVAFSVLNTQLMSVLERTREFGIVMALGISPGRLGRLVLLETALMGFMGFVGGAVLGALVTGWFAANGFSYPGMDELTANFNLPSRVYPPVAFLPTVIGPLVVYFFSMVSALYPALRLNWLQPVEAMRAA